MQDNKELKELIQGEGGEEDLQNYDPEVIKFIELHKSLIKDSKIQFKRICIGIILSAIVLNIGLFTVKFCFNDKNFLMAYSIGGISYSVMYFILIKCMYSFKCKENYMLWKIKYNEKL